MSTNSICINLNKVVLANNSKSSINQIRTQQEVRQVLNAFPNLKQSLNKGKSQNKKSISIPFTGFLLNEGQVTNSQIKYYYSSQSSLIGFSTSEILFSQHVNISESESKFIQFSISFTGSNKVEPTGNLELNQNTNFFTNNNAITSVKSFKEIWFYNIYNHIDLRYYMSDSGLKYEFIVNPGGNPNDIIIHPSSNIQIGVMKDQISFFSSSNSNFEIIADSGLLVTQGNGNNNISAQFSRSPITSNSYGFQIQDFNVNEKLIIDPVWLGLSTYIGGNGNDYGRSITVDQFGNIYVTGYTSSASGFPLVNPYQATYGTGSYDAFVMKLNATGTGIIFSTYIGGTGDDQGYGIAIDYLRNIYVTGHTTSSFGFPLVNPYQSICSGGDDAFILKMNPKGTNLIFSTYFGGGVNDQGNSIAVDKSGYAYITGITGSLFGFPLVNAYNSTFGGVDDAFIVKMNPTGSNVIFSTFIGGKGDDGGFGIAVDSSNNCYITGYTSSSDFPLKNAYNSTYGGGSYDAFILKLNSTGTGLEFSTYIGGNDFEIGYGIAIDSSGNSYITGTTSSSGYFPLKNAYNSTYGGGTYDAFVTKLNATGNGIDFSTYIGGSGNDQGFGIAVDGSNNSYIIGYTSSSSDFPLKNAYQSTYGGGLDDTFVTKLNATGTGMDFSTFIGGSSADEGHGIAVDAAGNTYITGLTFSSSGFPLVNAYQSTFGTAVSDAFVVKIERKLYSTYIGGGQTDYGYGIAVDRYGNSYITGFTRSTTDFPILNSYQSNYGGGSYDAFVLELNATGTGVIFSTYFGGSRDDFGNSITVDSFGNSYVTGYTSSNTDFPLINAYQSNYGGGTYDTFIIRLNATGTGLDFSTYIGGAGADHGNGIAVDEFGNSYITGYTSSNTDFPLINAYQSSYGGGPYDAFIMKLNATGTGFIFSTYIGGNKTDRGFSIAIDSGGNSYITGETASNSDFPIVNAYQSIYGGGTGDAFVMKLNALGTRILFSTYIGGNGADQGSSIAVDSNNNTYITGSTQSPDGFPLVNAYQPSYVFGLSKAFVTKLNATGTGIIFSTYIGGIGDDFGYGITVDSSGNSYVTGSTSSNTGFPIINAYQPYYGGGSTDAFIMKLNATGTGVIFSTYIGGNAADSGYGIAVDSSGNCYITGSTASNSGFPIVNAFQSKPKGISTNVFIMKLPNIDDTAPVIFSLNYVNNSIILPNTMINFQAIDLNSEIMQYKYNWNGGTNTTVDLSRTLSLAYLSISAPNISSINKLNLYVRDSANNVRSKSYSYIVDGSSPKINLISPFVSSTHQSGTIIKVDISDNTGVNQTLYHWDNNSNMTLNSNILLPFGDGIHTLHVYAQDIVGNWNSSQFIFQTDDTAPIIQLQNINDNSIIKPGTKIDLSITEINLQNAYYYWDTQSQNYIDLTNPYSVIQPTEQTIHTLHIFVVDKAGNWANSTFSFQTDSEKPNIDINSSNYSTVSGTIDLNFTATDNFGLKSISYVIENTNLSNLKTFNINNKVLEYKVSNSIDFSSLKNGDYILNITVIDIAGNINSSLITIKVNNNSNGLGNSNQNNFEKILPYLIGVIIIGIIGSIAYYLKSPFRKRHLANQKYKRSND